MSNKKEEVILKIIVKNKEGLKAIGEYQQSVDNLKAKQKEYGDQLKAQTINKQEYRQAMNETSAAIKFQQEGIRILNKELQNNVKQEMASTGSIDGMKASLSKLTAQYGALSAEQRNGAKGLEIKNNIVAIDKALKDEEQSLGNFRRQVGNYEVATKSLKSEMRQLVDEMARMKREGLDGTEAYVEMAKKASEMNDAIGDVQREVGVGASDTKGLDTTLQSVTTLTASMTALNSIQGLVTEDNKMMQEALQKAQLLMAALSAAIAIQNTFQKESAVIKGIVNLQRWAGIKALAAEKSAIVGATVAQKLWNAIAKANPYILLATALLSVIGALVLFARGSETAAEKQEKLNQKSETYTTYLGYQLKRIRETHEAEIKKAESDLAYAKAKGVSMDEIQQKELAISAMKKAMHTDLSNLAHDEINDIRQNQQMLDHYNYLIKEYSKSPAKKEVRFVGSDGKNIKQTAEEAIETIKGIIPSLETKIDIGLNIKTNAENDNNEQKLNEVRHQKERSEAAKEARQKELDAVRAAQDSILAIAKEGQDKEIAAANVKYARQIEDLKLKYKSEDNLTKKAKTKILETIKALEEAKKQEIDKINKAFSAEQFNLQMEAQKMAIETRLLNAKAGSEAEHQLKMQSIAQAMDEELRANADKEERLQIDSQLIRNKYIAQMEVAERERLKTAQEKEIAEVRFAIENRLLEAQMAGDNELQAKLEAKQAEIAMLAQLEDEGDQAFLNRKLQLAAEEKAIIRDITDTKVQETSDMLSAIGGAFGAISGLMEDMAEDNEALATFSKVLALFEIGLNTASAFAAIPAMATKGDPYTYPIRVATAIVTAVGAIGQAYAVINKQKQPKAPKLNKYATGGLVSGAGSGTSDSIPAMLSSGESVLNAMTTAMFAPILSSFNQIGGGVPIQVHNTSAQVMGEDMLARAFAKGAASLPAPVVNVQEITNAQTRIVTIEQLGTI